VNVLEVRVKIEVEIRVILDFEPDKNRIHNKDNNFDEDEKVQK
jgi:hypothetical protein